MKMYDWKLVEEHIVEFIQDYVHNNGFENVVVGVSGGLDSAVTAFLCVRALGVDHVHGLLMPFRTSSPESLVHGRLVCETLKIPYDTVDISASVFSYFNRFPATHPLQIPNKCARERMSVLYDFSVRKNALVVGTSNKSEIMIGYCTQYGDSAAAFEPIGDLYKTQIFEFAKYLGIPEAIINKKPSADLWEGQTDEGEIGLSYADLDEILSSLQKEEEDNLAIGYMEAQIGTLEHFFKEALALGDIIEVINSKSKIKELKQEIKDKREKMSVIYNNYTPETITKVKDKIRKSQFKREMPPIAKMWEDHS